jgi:uncharacterized Fe-S cluster protein YjdI
MKRYQGRSVDVTVDPARCLHAAECLRGLPSVFDVKRRPWIEPDGADAADVADVVSRCPSGALHVIGIEEEPERPTRIDGHAPASAWTWFKGFAGGHAERPRQLWIARAQRSPR